MPKKLILVLGLSFFLLSCRVAFASLIINEVKYSPTTKQWVEIYNDTDDDVDITTYKILDSGAATNGHGISVFGEGTNLIPKHGFGIIAKVPDDFGAVSFPLFKSSLGIKVSSDKIILRDNTGADVSSVDIDGSAVDGNSWQLVNGSWVGATPTPGAANEAVVSPPVDSSSSESSSTTTTTTTSSTSHSSGGGSSTVESKPKVVEPLTMKAKILANTLAFAGQPLEIKTDILGFSNEKVVLGRAYWNFGDGSTLEQVNNFEKFSHIYYYPGEYALFLEYYQNSYSKIPEVTNKMTIKVLPTTVIISKVGDAKDFFIELSNSASSDIDISNWVIKANGKIFTLPKNSVIITKEQMTIPGKITGFRYGDQSDLKLFSSTGEIVFDYASLTPIPTKIVVAQTSKPPVLAEGSITIPTTPAPDPKVALASAISSEASDVVNNGGINNSRTIIISIASIALIGLAAYAVYFIRRKRVTPQPGSDFEILDE